MCWLLVLALMSCGTWVLANGPTDTAPSPSKNAGVANAWKADEDGYQSIARPFFDTYCMACHGAVKPKGSFRVDKLANDFLDSAARAQWGEVVNVLNSHTMPPEKSKQPPASAVAKVVDWVTAQAVRAEQSRRQHVPIARRLTREEYRATILDLTGVEWDVSGFPADPLAGGFDNNASALTVSPLHIELYAAAAREILDEALVSGPQPREIRWRFDPKVVPGDSRRIQLDEHNRHVIINGGNNREEGDWIVVHTTAWDKSVNARHFRMPHEGYYTVRLRAASRVPTREQVVQSAEKILAHRRANQMKENPKGAKYHEAAYQRDLQHFREHPMYNYGPPRVRLIQHLGPQPRTVAEFDVDATLDKPKTYEFRARFTTEMAGLNWENVYSIPRELENFWFQGHDHFARPDLLVDWFELEGPEYPSWPPLGHQKILFERPKGANERDYARAVVGRFLRRAYRRPVSDAEIDAKMALYDTTRADQPFLSAIKTPLIAALTSSHFLYLQEPTVAEAPADADADAEDGSSEYAPRPLNNHELAARLSYFLWGTMPDEELFQLADAGKLQEPRVLRQQTERLLKDGKSRNLVRRFVGQWLGLGQVGANPPAMDLYPQYDRHYETSMIAESEEFFAEVLFNDLDARYLVRADFVVINERLARAYHIPGVKGDHFRRVEVTPEMHRGGIPTQASILTITSNGTRTSPVKRGTWILKTLLNADPGIPVADAGEIAARVPGIEKATVRKRLEIHRTRAQCARCHSHIDPLGFALENYDAAGIWREREGFGYKGRVERDDPPVDNTSILPDGTTVKGILGLQKAVLRRQQEFEACLASKLFTFALGRELVVADRPMIQEAVAHMIANDRTLRSLIHFIVRSPTFQTK